jgi:hypothetical protein
VLPVEYTKNRKFEIGERLKKTRRERSACSRGVWSLLLLGTAAVQKQGLTLSLFASLVNQLSPPNCSYDTCAEWLSQEAP